MTNTELKNLCKNRGISGYSSKNKLELIGLLSAQKEENTLEMPSAPSAQVRYIDLFCGLGAFHTAFNSSKDNFKCVLACDIDNGARRIYEANYGLKPEGDIRKIDLATMPDFEILCAGFPCFVAGTSVLTNQGYKHIEHITLDDQLFTHTGKFQRILNLQQKTHSTEFQIIKIKYHPHDIQSTPEHPFYVKERTRIWNNKNRRYEYVFSEPLWLPASKITTEHFAGMAINIENCLPTFHIPVIINSKRTDTVSITLDKKDEWFMMGYFLGDGWIQENKKKDGRLMHIIRFAINNKDEDNVLKRISSILPITDKLTDTGKCKKFGCSNVIWYTILKQFGKYAHGKIIPEWIQSAPKEYIQEFLDGYKSADGCIQPSSRGIPNHTISYTTVSNNIAYGIQRLYLKLGQLCSIQYFERPTTCIIEGRQCNQRSTYRMLVTISPQRLSSSFIENDYAWFKIDTVISTQTEPQTVYNFEVEHDNSYCVENTIVHNCQPFSIAGKQEGFKDEVKGNLFYDILKIIDAKNPPMCILENVKNLETHDNGNTYKTIVAELKKRNYLVTSKVINATEYGSPQARQRIFIIATRDKAFTIPVPTKTTNPVSTIIDKTVEKSDLDLDRYKMVNKRTKTVVPSKPHVIADVFPKLSEEKEKAVKEQNKTYEKTLKSLKEKLKAAEDKLNSTDDAKKDKANIAAVKTVKKEMLGIQAKMKPKGGRQGERVYSTDAVGVTVCASSGGPGAKTGLYKVGNFVRRLTVKETLGMFGFPADYKFPETTVEDSLFYLGNSIVVNIPLAFVPTIAAWFGKA